MGHTWQCFENNYSGFLQLDFPYQSLLQVVQHQMIFIQTTLFFSQIFHENEEA